MRPIWLRVNPQIRQFVLGEVERQYHPIGTLEYKTRVEWMTDAWMWAQEQAADHRRPTVEDILFIAGRIEPEMNHLGFRRTGVWIGGREAPNYSRVPSLVESLWRDIDKVLPQQGSSPVLPKFFWSVDDFYLEFEHIHPFSDGNGRTGKILYNWLLGTLDNPVLIADYFGGGNP